MRKLFLIQTLIIDDHGGIVSAEAKTINRPYCPGPAPTLQSKSDAYSNETLTWLLRRVGITDCDWVLREFSPERILQITCYVLKRQLSGQVADLQKYAISAFRHRYSVPDFRNEILPKLCRFELPNRAPPSHPDRKQAAKLLDEWLKKRGCVS